MPRPKKNSTVENMPDDLYKDPTYYELKLKKVMKRFNASEYDYDWSRKAAWVRFKYKGQFYQFDHSVEKVSNSQKAKITSGTDAFAQLVLALEDLARMVERGIYELNTWISGMLYLPPVIDLPDCFKVLGYAGNTPPSESDIKTRYRNLAKEYHPDSLTADEEKFRNLEENTKKCMDYIKAINSKD